MDMGKMHKRLVKIACVVLEISCRTDAQTHRQTCSSQYFATAPAGEVTNIERNRIREASIFNDVHSIRFVNLTITLHNNNNTT